MSLKNVMLGLLFIFSVALSCWSILLSKKSTAPKPTFSKQEPDAFMEHVVATFINKKGAPAFKIESPKMIHFPNKDATEIETPHIVIYRNSPEPWHIHSDFAKATLGIENIVFWGNVLIQHKQDAANPTTTIRTESLTVFPNKNIAQTDEAITLIQPTTTIHAVGMLANMNDGTIKLISQTRGEYEPGS